MSLARDEAINRFYGEVGGLVQAARTKRGFSQVELGAKVELTRSSIANLEAGRQRIRLHILALIADVLRVNLSDLLPDHPLGLEGDGLAEVEKIIDPKTPDNTRRFVESVVSQLTSE
jgi:transcriptional regulator with XRE-family HTH domain